MKVMKFQVHCPKTRVIHLKLSDNTVHEFTHNDIVDRDDVFVKYPHVFMPRPDLMDIEPEIEPEIETIEPEIELVLDVVKIKKGTYKVVDNNGDKVFPDGDATCKKKAADEFIKEFKR